ncbi:hypothetical protein CAC42_4688 [Sphaceloma murrayae]|uniref:Tyrosine-protein phosphatase domain-containing protein n=1 Tax=Sphaceloma murrayae TaxID=2082308 RepID=A0A2K1QNM2_9PEZI|nr:hypothetical protein CAC42_4688 [Sphaceloma murrayae]
MGSKTLPSSPPDYYHATSHFQARVPSPPRIHIPAPLPDTRTMHESIPYITPLSAVAPAQVSTSAALDWSYNQRRSAQQILPHLHLGPISCAKDASYHRSHGITLLLGIRAANRFQAAAHDAVARLAASSGLQSRTVVADSLPELIRVFPEITAAINDHVSSSSPASAPKKVLLFCESGNDRSAGACAAYLISVLHGVDHIKAMQLVQSQRFCCNFDDGLKRLLQGYWDIVRAEREVNRCLTAGKTERDDDQRGYMGSFGATGPQNAGCKAKRGREVDAEAGADADMDVQDDLERFGGRTFVPFVDYT